MDNLTNIKELWREVIKNLEAEVGADATALWIKPIKPLFIENDTLKIEVPDSIIYNTIKDRYEEKSQLFCAPLPAKS